MPRSGDPLLKLSEVAELLRRSPRTLRRWRRQGFLQDVRLGGGIWTRRSDLERALCDEPLQNLAETV